MKRRDLFAAGVVGTGAAGLAAVSAETGQYFSDLEAEKRLAKLKGMRFHPDSDPDNPVAILTREHLNRYVQTGTLVPNVELVTHDERTVHFYEDCVKGKIVLINFMYTNCLGKCPLVHENLVKVQRQLGGRLGKEFYFYSISLDPEEDSPEVLREYMKFGDVKEGWTFLTGKYETTEYLRRALGFIDPDPVKDSDRTNHAGVVLYGDESTNRWAACPGQLEPSEIVFYLDRLTGKVGRRRKSSQVLPS